MAEKKLPKKAKKLPVKATFQIDAYAVIERAVEEGIRVGWNHAHKHLTDPDQDALLSEIFDAVMNALSEVVEWPDADGKD